VEKDKYIRNSSSKTRTEEIILETVASGKIILKLVFGIYDVTKETGII
jgi:DNA-binding CsgD family transcriptional regulator